MFRLPCQAIPNRIQHPGLFSGSGSEGYGLRRIEQLERDSAKNLVLHNSFLRLGCGF